jgi:hypothetical protein
VRSDHGEDDDAGVVPPEGHENGQREVEQVQADLLDPPLSVVSLADELVEDGASLSILGREEEGLVLTRPALLNEDESTGESMYLDGDEAHDSEPRRNWTREGRSAIDARGQCSEMGGMSCSLSRILPSLLGMAPGGEGVPS